MTLSPMVKLITYHTPSHDALAARLLASEISEYRVMQVRGNQLGDGLFCGLGFHAIFQDDGPDLCTGLFAMRYNQRCLDALDRWVTEMEREPENDIDHDQS